MHVAPSRLADDSCHASAKRWQSEAECLREQAELRHLTPKQRAVMLREAQAADRQAGWWLGGVEHC